jgi:chromatin modification-related protein EAF6
MTESAASGVGVGKSAAPNGNGGGGGGDAAGSAAGIPFYEKQRQHLKSLIAQRRALERKLVCGALPFPLLSIRSS